MLGNKRKMSIDEQKCVYGEDIGYIKSTIGSLDKRINGSMDAIKEHIRQGDGWRKAIIGIIFAGIIQVVTFAYTWGVMNEKVNAHLDNSSQVLYKLGIFDEKISWLEEQILEGR